MKHLEHPNDQNHSPIGLDPTGTAREREDDVYYFNKLREHYNIKISKSKSISLLEYVRSLELDPNIFKISTKKKLTLGDYVYFFDIELSNASIEKSTTKWEIKKRCADIVAFKNKLNEELIKKMKLPKKEIPQLCEFYDTKCKGNSEVFLEAAETYLRKLVETPKVRENSKVLYEFLEMSLLPLANAPHKCKEGYLQKKGGGRFKQNKWKIYCSAFFAHWQERWFILTEEGILYSLNSCSTKAREMLLFDQTFQIEFGRKATGIETGISVYTSNRRLNLKASNFFEAIEWVGEIQKAAKNNPYTKSNRFDSFAPVREATHDCKFLIDGQGYFEELYNALTKAKREVFITDWWLSPEIALKRPVEDSESEYRLDKVLGRIARSGVKVYVIVYHEVRMLMYNDSLHTKQALESQSDNITVLQHPSEPFFSWSHHEKMVVIDQQVGFIGGLDLCFGRMDTNDHPINDPAFDEGKGELFQGQDFANLRVADFQNVKEHQTPLIDKSSQPRMPFHDAMIKVTGPVVADMSRHFIQFWNHVKIDVYGKEEEAPLPMNNVQAPPDESLEKRENASLKLRNAFRKIFADKVRKMDIVKKMQKLVAKKDSFSNRETLPTLSSLNQVGEMDNKAHKEEEKQSQNDQILHKKSPVKGEPEEEKVSPNTSIDEGLNEERKRFKSAPQMVTNAPHDVLFEDKDSKLLEETTTQKVIHYILAKGASVVNFVRVKIPFLPCPKRGERKEEEEKILELPEGNEEDKEETEKYAKLLKSIRDKERLYDKEFQHKKFKTHQIHLGSSSPISPGKFIFGKDEEKFKKEFTDQFYEKQMAQLLFAPREKIVEGTIACQMLRSVAKWSLGLNSRDGNIENSIQNAYIDLIHHSKHCIYIENQFFMSSTAGDSIKNEVAKAIIYRIEKAHTRKERFRVIVFLPLVPAFAGEIVDSKSALLKVQMHWQYMTICRGGTSIYEVLREKGITPEDYIQFYSKRSHGKMKNGKPATEMIYIHSKIMVVDDNVLLIGSANINDRSLQGSRDSEIAMTFEDSKKVQSHMNGKPAEVSEFVHNFRKRLLAEHTGLSEDEVEDPISEEFTKKMNEITQKNTEIFREIFACYPDDTVKKLDQIEEFTKNIHWEKYDELAPQITGHIVWFPLEFCAEDSLTPSLSTMEHYVPTETFV